MTDEHTPGPWICQRCGEKNTLNVVINLPPDRCQPIADIDCTGVQNGEAKANARLIAAAPKLLEALEAIDDMENCQQCHEQGERNIDQHKAVGYNYPHQESWECAREIARAAIKTAKKNA